MATNDGTSKGFAVWGFALTIVTLALAVLVYWLDQEKTLAKQAYEDARNEYDQMLKWHRRIASQKRGGAAKRPKEDRSDDLVVFLGSKARQSQIPSTILNIAPERTNKTGSWEETPFTVTLRAPKADPLSREAVARFIAAVEKERDSVRVRNLNLTFAQQDKVATGDFSSAVITFSHFKRAEPVRRSGPRNR